MRRCLRNLTTPPSHTGPQLISQISRRPSCKNKFPKSIDAPEKPYYCESRNLYASSVTATALPGLAPNCFLRAAATSL
jgi:hypothetical protein